MARLFLCAACNRMVVAENGHLTAPCLCGHRYFKRPGWAPWKLTAEDRRFLRSLRISADADDASLPLNGAPS